LRNTTGRNMLGREIFITFNFVCIKWIDLRQTKTKMIFKPLYTSHQIPFTSVRIGLDWIGLSSVLRPRQHSIGCMGDGFYRSKDPTNRIKVLKEKAVKEKPKKHKENTNYTYGHTHKIAYKYSIQK